ncbi:DEAD/DEAH box helicase [Clostridium celatum]|uniref:ATP-dependent RNA helicase CshA n=1 Tax=Clostridium celatum DSM 1785 TaxID=545697 RepID=L1QIE4_9CLOT|nr:DEAD/DEAH box helicase [Clostridium celatum]EKY27337.1 putative ATP-dependent RNA helicase RhlE [Clostridium celatum DSM 1785]MCE9656780.1 DEAD/DEAH box helicase [Clostridium celatum]MDU2266380.1 DEAD/DEAH box helicase [Clostridium celatum]MDU3722963.1 DEAD/DEAH box helicase [Clostridium celatum]MDU6296623.1 DEAD/DEAH box helicase [Clostridium celatum]
MIFKELNVIEPVLKAISEAGYEKPTEIQENSIPVVLKGRDILGCAQTGTGKTAAFAIPIIQNIVTAKGNSKERSIKALIVAPTRELAIQIEENFTIYAKYLDIKNTVIFGGVNQTSQVRKINAGVDVLVATPGRLLDLVNQRHIDLSNVKYFVLDEADRMLDMGMIHDVKKIISKLPKERQNLLFSATMPKEVTKLVNSILKNPVKVEVQPVSSTAEIISQGVYFVPKKNKKSLLIHLLKDESIKSVIVFSRTKHGANKIAKDLEKAGIQSAAIHGNKSQNQRQLALNNFKEGNIRVLVATDIAARGIDIDELSHVINYDLPDVAETYVHRIGRTGRAGASGVAITFCDEEEKAMFRSIEKIIGKSIPVLEEEYEIIQPVVTIQAKSNSERNKGNRNNNNRNKNRNGKSNYRSKSYNKNKPNKSSN